MGVKMELKQEDRFLVICKTIKEINLILNYMKVKQEDSSVLIESAEYYTRNKIEVALRIVGTEIVSFSSLQFYKDDKSNNEGYKFITYDEFNRLYIYDEEGEILWIS